MDRDLDALIDALYGGAPAQFTGARDALVRSLRAEGRVGEADQVRALRRPSKLAADINRLVREDPARAQALVTAQTGLAAAQARILSGDGDAAALRDAEAVEAAAIDAFPTDPGLRAALRVAARSPRAGEDLLRGRLTHDPAPEAGTGGLFALGPARPRDPTDTPPTPPPDELADARRARASRAQAQGEPEDEAATRRREEELRAAIAALDEARRGEEAAAEARDAARRAADEAAARAAALADEHDALRRRLDEVAAAEASERARAEEAAAALTAAEAALRAATRARDGAERAARRLAEEAPG